MIGAIDRLSAALADRYRIERELGKGGMATVYLAHDIKHDRKVALKVLNPDLAAALGAERFLAEIKTTANLQHPHILPLFDSGTADGFLFYVMPFIDGETLRAKLDRETQLGVDEAVRIARDVADALVVPAGLTRRRRRASGVSRLGTVLPGWVESRVGCRYDSMCNHMLSCVTRRSPCRPSRSAPESISASSKPSTRSAAPAALS